MTRHRLEAERPDKLRIVMAASEAVPWSKTGGLADVSTALAKSLAAAGNDVTLIAPYHRQTPFAVAHEDEIHDTGVSIDITVGSTEVSGSLYWTNLPNSDVRVVLVDQPDFFDRASLYQDSRGDYSDNCERFVFFSRAVIEVCKKLVLRPNIIHANDWQTGLVPALLDAEQRGKPGFENTKCIFTIHNLAYQGWFWHLDMPLTGLDWKYFNPESDGMSRTAESAQDGNCVCRSHHDGQPHIRDRDSNTRVRLRTGRVSPAARIASDGDPQWN